MKRFVAIATIALVSACVGPEPSGVRGKVIDVSTSPPSGVDGARLLFLFRGSESVFPESVDFCDGASLGMSGPGGFFDLPSMFGREVHVIAYKRGYVLPVSLEDRKRREVYLKKDEAHDAAIKNLDYVAHAASCASIGTNSQPIADFLIPLLHDARSEAQNADEEAVVKRIEQRIRLYDRKSN